MAASTRDRFLATLQGLACGAAAGEALRFRTAKEIRAGGGIGDPAPAAAGLAAHHLSQVTLWVESLAATGKLDLEDVSRRYLEWLGPGSPHACSLTREAVAELKAGASPADAGRLVWEKGGQRATGNGGLLTAIPVALLHVGELRGVADDAAAASRLTHYDPRCVAACRALAMGIALVVRGQEDAAVERASLMASPSPPIREVIDRAPDADPRKLPLDGDDREGCTRTVEAAFAAFCWAPGFEKGLRAVLERGGDTAVNGAISGALLGARFAPELPAAWLSSAPGGDRLVAAGEQLLRRIFPGSGAAAA